MLFGTSAGTGGSVDLGSVTQNLAKVQGPKSGPVGEDSMGRTVIASSATAGLLGPGIASSTGGAFPTEIATTVSD